jgi:hypothetical protein
MRCETSAVVIVVENSTCVREACNFQLENGENHCGVVFAGSWALGSIGMARPIGCGWHNANRKQG